MPAQAMFEKTSATLKADLDICNCCRLVRSVAADANLGDISPTLSSSSTSLQFWFVREGHAIVIEEFPLSFRYSRPL
jgi:hypothetical protein